MKPLALALLLALSTLSLAAPTLADIPPPDQCGTAGSPCNTAPPDFTRPGTCVTQKCQKFGREYDCNRCQSSAAPSGSAVTMAGVRDSTA